VPSEEEVQQELEVQEPEELDNNWLWTGSYKHTGHRSTLW
jgi:hypothetical protein